MQLYISRAAEEWATQMAPPEDKDRLNSPSTKTRITLTVWWGLFLSPRLLWSLPPWTQWYTISVNSNWRLEVLFGFWACMRMHKRHCCSTSAVGADYSCHNNRQCVKTNMNSNLVIMKLPEAGLLLWWKTIAVAHTTNALCSHSAAHTLVLLAMMHLKIMACIPFGNFTEDFAKLIMTILI